MRLDLLNKFQEEKCHLGLVTSNPEAVEEAWGQHQEVPPVARRSSRYPCSA